MSVPPDSTRTGRDGKSYPAQMPPLLAWRWRAATLTHRLCHELGYSQRAAQRELARRGDRCGLGTVCYDLSRPLPGCARCRGASGPAGRLTHASHPAGRPPPAIRQAGPGPPAGGPTQAGYTHTNTGRFA